MNRNSDWPSSHRQQEGQSPLTCAMCGLAQIESTVIEEPFVYGSGSDTVTLSARIPIRKCLACGFEFTDADAEDARHEAVCRHLGVLTPSEIVELRQSYSLSRSDFTRLTRLGEATLARWERGALIQNLAYDRYLRLLMVPAVLQILQAIEGGASLPLKAQLGATSSPVFRSLSPERQSQLSQGGFVLRRAA